MQPASSAGTSLLIAMNSGTFHGMIAATTPTGSRRTTLWPNRPLRVSSHGKVVGELGVDAEHGGRRRVHHHLDGRAGRAHLLGEHGLEVRQPLGQQLGEAGDDLGPVDRRGRRPCACIYSFSYIYCTPTSPNARATCSRSTCPARPEDAATVVASGLTAPQQLFLDENASVRLHRGVHAKRNAVAHRPGDGNQDRAPSPACRTRSGSP